MDPYQAYHDILQAGSRPAYQAAVLLSALLGGWLIRRDSGSWPLPLGWRIAILAVATAGSLIGCALPAFFAGGFVASLSSTYLLAPKTILGGMLFGFLAVAVLKRTAGVAFDTSDAFARGGCLMMAVGRLGCIAQHCCFGRPTTSWLGLDFGDGMRRFPVQMIEAAFLFGLFALLSHLHQRDLLANRRMFLLFAVYGAARFLLEFLRAPVADLWLGLGFYQWLAVVVCLTGCYQIARRTLKQRQEDATPTMATEAAA